MKTTSCRTALFNYFGSKFSALIAVPTSLRSAACPRSLAFASELDPANKSRDVVVGMAVKAKFSLALCFELFYGVEKMNKLVKDKNMSWVIPYLIVADAGIAAQYYVDHFGFEILSLAKGDDGKTFHAELRYKDIVIMCGSTDFCGETIKTPAAGNFKSPVTLYVYHENVDALYNTLTAQGVKVAAPENQFWGDRMLRLTDSDGHQWSFATKVAEHA